MIEKAKKLTTECCSKCKEVKKREEFTKLYSGGKPLCKSCKEVLDLKNKIERTQKTLNELRAQYAVLQGKPQYKTPEYESQLKVHSWLPLAMNKNKRDEVWIVQSGTKRRLTIRNGKYGAYVSFRPNKARYSAWKNYSVEKLYKELFDESTRLQTTS